MIRNTGEPAVTADANITHATVETQAAAGDQSGTATPDGGGQNPDITAAGEETSVSPELFPSGTSIYEYGDGGTRNEAAGESGLPALSLALLANIVWSCGAAAVGVCLAASNAVFYLRLRRARSRFECAGCQLPVYIVEKLRTPCLFGVPLAAIYITPGIALDETTLRHVVAHENAHYRHRDNFWALFRGICLCLHWYNPLVWLAAILSMRELRACKRRVRGEDTRRG